MCRLKSKLRYSISINMHSVQCIQYVSADFTFRIVLFITLPPRHFITFYYLSNITMTNQRGHVIPPTCCTRASRALGNERTTIQRRELICIITFCRLQKALSEGVSSPSRCSLCNSNCTQFTIMLRVPWLQVLFKSRFIRLTPE